MTEKVKSKYSNIYAVASTLRILAYTNFFSKEEYREELVERLVNDVHGDVCFDNNDITIQLDTDCNVSTIVSNTLLDFMNNHKAEVITALKESDLDPDVYFDLLINNIDWLFDIIYTTNTAVVKF